MRLEVKERGTKEYYDEFLYVVSKYKEFKKNPRRKAYQFTKYLILCNIFVLFALLINFYFYFDTKDLVFIFMTGALTVALIIQVVYLVMCIKRIKQLLNTKGVRIIEFNEDGVEYIDDDKNIRVKWEDLKYVIINKYSICMLPKAILQGFTSVSVKYKNDVIKGLKKYNKESLLIDNGHFYKQIKEENMEEKKCNCTQECECGCQEGKECTCDGKCDESCECGCHEEKECTCGK